MRTPTTGLLLIAVLATPMPAGEKLYVSTSSVVHKGTGETAIGFPDICKTPLSPDAGTVPLPYPFQAAIVRCFVSM